MSEQDRLLLKEKSGRPEIYRAHSGDGDCSWMARLQKSAIEAFHLLEAGHAQLELFPFPPMLFWEYV